MYLLHAGRIYPQIDWAMKAHKHSGNHELIIVLSGVLQTIMEERIHEVYPGEMIIYPQNILHEEKSIGQQPLETIFLCWSYPDPLEVRAWPRKGKDVLGRVQMLANWILELFPPKSVEEEQMMQMQLELIMHEFHRSQIPMEDQLEMRLRRFLQKHLADSLCLDDLAQAMEMTKYHFVRKFKAETGVSPMSYLRQMRIQNAQNLLVNTPIPIKSIAPQVGLVDEYHFSRVFSRMVGLSPREYRKKALEN